MLEMAMFTNVFDETIIPYNDSGLPSRGSRASNLCCWRGGREEKNLGCNLFSFERQDVCLRMRLSSSNLACCSQQWVAISFYSKYSLITIFTWPFWPLEVFSQELAYCGAATSLCMPVTSDFKHWLLDAWQNGQHQQVQVGQTLHADYHSNGFSYH